MLINGLVYRVHSVFSASSQLNENMLENLKTNKYDELQNNFEMRGKKPYLLLFAFLLSFDAFFFDTLATEMSQVGQSQYGSNYGSHYGGGAGTTAYNKPKFTRTGTKVDIQGQEAAAPPKNPQVEVEEIERARGEQIAFVVLLVLFEVAMLIIMGVWFDYVSDAAAIVENKELYPYILDVFIMVVDRKSTRLN